MLYHNDFRERILLDPIRDGANQLKIISGYATPTMASWHLTEEQSKEITIKLIVGMCPLDGINKTVHQGFQNLVSMKMTKPKHEFTCQYVVEGSPVHSKMYLWEKNKIPFRAFIGSANYTQAAFSQFRHELLHECDPKNASTYFDLIEPKTMYCNHAEIADHVRITNNHPAWDAETTPQHTITGNGSESVTLSLLARGGEVGDVSGLNWGHRKSGTRNRQNDTYIPVPAKVARSGFFPSKEHFTALTDDNKLLILRTQQQNDKAITTPLNNELLGEYFRGRLGKANGAYVTKQDLLNYGRTDVTFYKIDDEEYYMDFSVRG